jgi:hypothetical protein
VVAFDTPSPLTNNFVWSLKIFEVGTKQSKGKKNMRTLNDYFLTVKMTDVSTSGSVFVPVPDNGRVIKIMSVIDGAIGTADAVITPSIGGTNITDGAITITQSGSAAGDVDTSEPTAANSVNEGDAIKLTTNGASSNTIAATFTIIIRR